MKLVNEFRGPFFITHFPSAQKAFYMRRTDDGQFVGASLANFTSFSDGIL